MPYIPYDGREFKEGMKIRLAGREATIAYIDLVSLYTEVTWGTTNDRNHLFLRAFPALEIFIEEPKISKEAAKYIMEKLGVFSCSSVCGSSNNDFIKVIIDSMIE